MPSLEFFQCPNLQFPAHLDNIMLWRIVLVAVREHQSDVCCELTPAVVLALLQLCLQGLGRREGRG